MMFENLYKQNLNKLERQEDRRKNLLQSQKLKRLELQDAFRQNQVAHPERKPRSSCVKYKNDFIGEIQLQISEWFKEKPDDLSDWLLLPCPKGQRCLVVAAKGKTKMFSKNKKFCMTFPSILPGGGFNNSNSNDYCILDCILNQEKNIFYVLDALHFAIPLIDCDAEFRFFWLKSKFNELNYSEQKYEGADAKTFQLLEKYDISDGECLTAVLHRYPIWPNNQPQLDGFLFYHKRSQYVFGTTPLVCWLFPFMLPDVLQIPVCSAYETPDDYCNQNPWSYMDEFDKHMAIKRNKKNLHQANALESILTEEKILEMDKLY